MVKILVFNRYYLPGYRAGGPIRTLANMVERLGSEFRFQFVTLDRDVGDKASYPGAATTRWVQVGKAWVHYVGSGLMTARYAADLVKEVRPDVIYLNSFFDPVFTQKVLLAKRLGWLGRTPVVLAPRGEFSPGALGLKGLKKEVYIKVTKAMRMYSDVSWQASSPMEAADIKAAMGGSIDETQILVAPNLPPIEGAGREARLSARQDDPEGQPLRVCFLSRISPMKNLDFALRVLAKVRAPIKFSIYGPKEVAGYWAECEQLIARLPGHVQAEYCGPVEHARVQEALAGNDLFLFPTRGENYGHVIHEALSAGLPVLLSDQTPWSQVRERGAGWEVSLNDEDEFIRIIEDVAGWNSARRAEARERATKLAMEMTEDPSVVESNRNLFLSVVGG